MCLAPQFEKNFGTAVCLPTYSWHWFIGTTIGTNMWLEILHRQYYVTGTNI